MLGIKRIVISDYQRGLEYNENSLVRVLEPGVYWYLDPKSRIRIDVYDISEPKFDHPHLDTMLKLKPGLMERYFQVLELNEMQVGLVYKNGALDSLVMPSTRAVYWNGPIGVQIEVIDISVDFRLSGKLASILTRGKVKSQFASLSQALCMAEVQDNHLGLLVVDGSLYDTLQAGLHAYWTFNRNVNIEQVDLRVQALEVQGQEILTKDKVSVRTNLSALYRISDPVIARKNLVNIKDSLYRELQFALRQAIGNRNLDALLSDKSQLDEGISVEVRAKLTDFGIEIHSVGLKDIILPGDMKDILNQVVEAEKIAQANVIKRREETNATRSLLNTAKLMDNNPILLRLKELEVLEKITEKVDKLTIYSGLDGVLNDTVKLRLDPN